MASHNKSYISFWGIKLLKFKKKQPNLTYVYLLGIPFLSVLKDGNNHRINIAIFYTFYHSLVKKIRKFINEKHQNSIRMKFKNGKSVNICLCVERPGTWCFDYLKKLLDNDRRFNTTICILPDPAYGIDAQIDYINETEKELCLKGHTPLKLYNHKENKYIDLRKEVNPDIIYYTDFGKWHYYNQYYITTFLDKITFLTDYGFSVMQDENACNFELNHKVNKYLRPTIFHKKMAEKFMHNQGRNVVVTGSPKLDARFDLDYEPKDVWKPQKQHKKRVIWAPHHSDGYAKDQWQFNAFYEIYDFMIEIAETYKDRIQFVFRPHPILKSYLIKRWGQEKQEEYYSKWDNIENGQYYMGEFVDLFMTSDAMILDSISFMAEYTAFDKPALHTVTSTSRVFLNDFGIELYKVMYKTSDNLKNDILFFINDVVLAGNDKLAPKRREFIDSYLGKINERTASENIYKAIVAELLK